MLHPGLRNLIFSIGGRTGTVNAALCVVVQCPLHAEAWRAMARVRAIGEVLGLGAERASQPHSWKHCSSKADTFSSIGADLPGIDSVEFVCLLVAELFPELVEVV